MEILSKIGVPVGVVYSFFLLLSERDREKKSLMQHCLHAVKLVKMSNRSEGGGTLATKVQILFFSSRVDFVVLTRPIPSK